MDRTYCLRRRFDVQSVEPLLLAVLVSGGHRTEHLLNFDGWDLKAAEQPNLDF